MSEAPQIVAESGWFVVRRQGASSSAPVLSGTMFR
jgi:hypothetical protein